MFQSPGQLKYTTRRAEIQKGDFTPLGRDTIPHTKESPEKFFGAIMKNASVKHIL